MFLCFFEKCLIYNSVPELRGKDKLSRTDDLTTGL